MTDTFSSAHQFPDHLSASAWQTGEQVVQLNENKGYVRVKASELLENPSDPYIQIAQINFHHNGKYEPKSSQDLRDGKRCHCYFYVHPAISDLEWWHTGCFQYETNPAINSQNQRFDIHYKQWDGPITQTMNTSVSSNRLNDYLDFNPRRFSWAFPWLCNIIPFCFPCMDNGAKGVGIEWKRIRRTPSINEQLKRLHDCRISQPGYVDPIVAEERAQAKRQEDKNRIDQEIVDYRRQEAMEHAEYQAAIEFERLSQNVNTVHQTKAKFAFMQLVVTGTVHTVYVSNTKPANPLVRCVSSGESTIVFNSLLKDIPELESFLHSMNFNQVQLAATQTTKLWARGAPPTAKLF